MSRRQRVRSAEYRERRTYRRFLKAGLSSAAAELALERLDREEQLLRGPYIGHRESPLQLLGVPYVHFGEGTASLVRPDGTEIPIGRVTFNVDPDGDSLV